MRKVYARIIIRMLRKLVRKYEKEIQELTITSQERRRLYKRWSMLQDFIGEMYIELM